MRARISLPIALPSLSRSCRGRCSWATRPMTSPPTTTGCATGAVFAVFAYNPRNEHLDPESLVNRGYDPYGTPYAPCGRLCRSNGYDYRANSRQYVCGRPCPPEEQQHALTALASWAIATA